MRSVNKVIIIGNLTRDPEMKQTPNGQNMVTFGVATNREWVTQDSERKSSAEFHECVAWAKLAEICNQYLRKGKLVYIEGYLKTRSWDTEEGIRKFKTEIVVEDMIMLNKKSDSGEDYVPTGGEESAEQKETPEEEETAEEEETPEEEETTEEEETAEKEPAEEEPAEETTEEEAPEGENPIDKDLGL